MKAAIARQKYESKASKDRTNMDVAGYAARFVASDIGKRVA
jgi:hypothetical protein